MTFVPRVVSGDADPRYKFTGKERDVESQYDYFGARYYDARIGRWLGVDPLHDVFRGISPFAYASVDPMNVIDPDGMKDVKSRDYARNHLRNIPYGYGLSPYPGAGWQVVNAELLSCDQLVARAYREGGVHLDFPVGMAEQVTWFRDNGIVSDDRNSADIGDVLFFGDVSTSGKRHEVLVSDTKDEDGQRYYKYIGARYIDPKTKERLPSAESVRWATIQTLEGWFNKSFAGYGAVNTEGEGESPRVAPHVSALNDKVFGLGPSPREMWNAFHRVAPADATGVGR